MRENPRDRLTEKDPLKRNRQAEPARVNQVLAGDAPQPREKFPGEGDVTLVGDRLAQVTEMAVINAKAVFEDELKSGAAGFGRMQKNHHNINCGVCRFAGRWTCCKTGLTGISFSTRFDKC